jgi:hypothetical protein
MRTSTRILARTSLTLLLLVAPGVAAAAGGPAQSATGGVHWTIGADVFGAPVVSRDLTFTAAQAAGGGVDGRFTYQQVFDGDTFRFSGRVTCLGVYDGNRAKLGGVIVESTDPTVPVGTFGWFQVFDLADGSATTPDQSSLVGFGDEAANEAFCASPALPRFGPWDVVGNVQVRG